MSPAKRRMSNILIASSIVFIAIGISAALYFYKIQKNEDHQNQLHFRELNVAAHNLENSLQQLKGVSKTFNSLYKNKLFKDKIPVFLNRIKTSPSLRQIELVSTPKKKQRTPLHLSNDGFSYYWDKVPQQIYHSIKNKPHTIFKASTADFLPNNLLSFPLIMIADEEGAILARKEYLGNSTHTTDLQFETVTPLLNALEKKQRNINELDDQHPAEGVTYSGAIQLKVGSLSYRVFIQPVSTNNLDVGSTHYYVLGFVPLADIQLGKLSISPDTGLWILVALLMLTASIPILKIHFFPRQHLYSKTDINLFFAGSILLLAIINIALNHNLFYNYLLETKYTQAKSFHKAISKDFDNEINAIRKQVEKEAQFTQISRLGKKCEGYIPNASDKNTSEIKYVYIDNCISTDLHFSYKDVYGNTINSFLESILKIDNTGRVERKDNSHKPQGYQAPLGLEISKAITKKTTREEPNRSNIDYAQCEKANNCNVRVPIYRISEKAFNFTDFDLSHREYYKHAINCEMWFYGNRKNCKDGFFIERIKNVSDGRLSSQLSFSDFNSTETTDMDHRTIISAATKLRTFYLRVLPENFGYAVFNRKGEVLYHSDESRVLLENILVETNGDSNIQTIMSSQNQGSDENDAVVFSGVYRNSESLFAGGPLSKAAPWKLVVFYKADTLSKSSLWTVLISISLMSSIIIFLMVWSRFITKPYFWSNILSYSPSKNKHYKKFAWAILGGIVFCLLSMGGINDLYARIAVWLCVVFILILRFSIKFDILPSPREPWFHPVFPFFLLGLVFLTLSITSWNNDSLDDGWSEMFLAVLSGDIFICLLFMPDKWTFKDISKSRHLTWLPLPSVFQVTKAISNLCEKFQRISLYRYTTSYVIYLSLLLWLFAIVPSTLIINSTNQFLLNYKAFNQTQVLRELFKDKQDKLESYSNLFTAENIPNNDVDSFSYILGIQPSNNTNENKELEYISWISLTEEARHLNPMLQALASSESIGGAVSKALNHYSQSKYLHDSRIRVHYDGNVFFQNALLFNLANTLFTCTLLFLFTLFFVKKYIVHRIMGEHLPDNFRTLKPEYENLCFDQISNIKKSGKRVRVQLIRTPLNTVIISLKHCLTIDSALKEEIVDIEEISSDSTYNKLKFLSVLKAKENHNKFIVLKGLERIAFDPTTRQNALSLLKNIDEIKTLDVILLCDIAPLFRLCKQSAFAGATEDSIAKINETTAWTNLLFKYEKLYDWNPSSKMRHNTNATIEDVVTHESTGWPALSSIKTLLDVQTETHPLSKWKPDQIIEFFGSHAGPIYRYKWELCTIDERLTLFQLANGSSVNPNNLETLEQLVKRGYIYRDCGWFIVNESFRRFVLYAETENTFAQWLEDTSSSSWQYVRIPIMITCLLYTSPSPRD